MEEKGTAVREGGLLAPGNAGADGDGADRRADVMPAGPGDRPATKTSYNKIQVTYTYNDHCSS